MKNILIIGAGASYGARKTDGFISTPPLGENLLSYLSCKMNECEKDPLKILYHHQGIFNTQQLNQLKEWFKRAQMRGLSYEKAIDDLIAKSPNRLDLGLLDQINRFLAFSFSCGDRKGGLFLPEFELKDDLYLDLVRKLNIDANWVVISLNYDVLFEHALLTAGIKFHYADMKHGVYPKTDDNSVEILKPHGSINWFGTLDEPLYSFSEAMNSVQSHADWNEELDLPNFESAEYIACNITEVLSRLASGNGTFPIMAHYGKDKYAHKEMRKLSKIRSKCIMYAKNSGKTFIVGVRLPNELTDDITVSKVFSELNESSTTTSYINPNHSDCARVRSIFPNIQTITKRMDEWLLSKC